MLGGRGDGRKERGERPRALEVGLNSFSSLGVLSIQSDKRGDVANFYAEGPGGLLQHPERKAIAAGEWDFVVLQQGPSASKEGRALLLEYSRRFAEEIRRAGARPALYAVWPPASRLQDFKGVSESYRHAAEAVDGLLFPVGDAWLGAWTVNPEIGLYSADGFHPSAAGTYLAGLVIYQRLYNEPPMGLPSKLRLSSGGRIEIPADQALFLQHAAEEGNKLIGRR